MKRRRRIEIVRYSRRTTSTGGDASAGATAAPAEREALDIVLRAAGETPPPPAEDVDAGIASDGPGVNHTRFFKLPESVT